MKYRNPTEKQFIHALHLLFGVAIVVSVLLIVFLAMISGFQMLLKTGLFNFMLN